MRARDCALKLSECALLYAYVELLCQESYSHPVTYPPHFKTHCSEYTCYLSTVRPETKSAQRLNVGNMMHCG